MGVGARRVLTSGATDGGTTRASAGVDRIDHRPAAGPPRDGCTDVRWVAVRGLSVLVLVVLLGGVPPAVAAPRAASPRQVTLQRLATLHVAAPLSPHGFTPARFPHWRDLDGNGCDAREDALVRAGTHVRRGPRCAIRSGVWRDAYTGAVLRRPGQLAVDQLVPLANAWRSGARRWTRARRTRYANDVAGLVVISRRVDGEKGALAPDRWKPPRRADWFGYAVRWIRIKWKYRLAVTASERAALVRMLDVPPANARVPVITGAHTVGATLTATLGTWQGSPTPILRRQWQRCGTTVRRASPARRGSATCRWPRTPVAGCARS